MILHSKITPERPQITPDHTRSSQNHAFVTLFLNVYFAALIIFSLLSSMNELIVAFEITVLFEHLVTLSTSSTMPRTGTSTFRCTCTRDLDSWRRFLPLYLLLHIILPNTVTCMIMFCMSFLCVVPFGVLIAICAFFISSYHRKSLSLLNRFRIVCSHILGSRDCRKILLRQTLGCHLHLHLRYSLNL